GARGGVPEGGARGRALREGPVGGGRGELRLAMDLGRGVERGDGPGGPPRRARRDAGPRDGGAGRGEPEHDRRLRAAEGGRDEGRRREPEGARRAPTREEVGTPALRRCLLPR